MTDEEILKAAARIRAARRRKTTKTCAVCGTEFEGIATKRYCSDRCRVQASRERAEDTIVSNPSPPETQEDHGPAAARHELAKVGMDRREGEDIVSYFDRVRAHISQGRVFDDSTEIIRQSRIERTNDLMRALGWDDLIEEP